MLHLFYISDPLRLNAGQIVAYQQGEVADAPPYGCEVLSVPESTEISFGGKAFSGGGPRGVSMKVDLTTKTLVPC